jgi:hypothetical protein
LLGFEGLSKHSGRLQKFSWQEEIYQINCVLGKALTQKRTAVRSFRFDVNIERKLAKVAYARGMSENALVSDLIARAIETVPLDHVIERISVSKEIFRSVIAHVPKDLCEIFGQEAAEKEVFICFEILKLDHELHSIFHFVNALLGDSFGWSKIEMDPLKNELLLIHDYGMKWSLFLKGYLSTMGKILHLTSEFEVKERLVKINFKATSNDLLLPRITTGVTTGVTM